MELTLYGKAQRVRVRSTLAVARFLKGITVRAVWCEMRQPDNTWLRPRLILATETDLSPQAVVEILHYNQARPHSALGPSVPDPPQKPVVIPKSKSRHRLAADVLVLAKSVLGGLHHEYSLETVRRARRLYSWWD